MPDAILIVGGGLLQVPAVEAAKKLGLVAVVTDASASAPALRVADHPVVLDIYDVAGHERLVEELAGRYRLRGVFTEGADVEYTVARAAAKAGVAGIPPEVAANTKNKVRMRERFDAAGIENPRWAEVRTLAEAKAEAERIGYPLVAKAVDNCASRGTMLVRETSVLPVAFQNAVENSTTRTALLEQCFSGEEQSVETIFDRDGTFHRLNIVDRLFRREEGYAIELGHANPTTLSEEQQDQIYRMVRKAADAVGVRFSVFKADTMWTPEGPRILEVTARLSGGFDCQYTTPMSTGRDFIRAAMRLALGEAIDPVDLRPKHRRHAVALAAFPPPGRVASIGGEAAALALPGVQHVFLRTKVGELIRPYVDNAARPAFVLASGETREEAVARARAGTEALRIETRPEGGS